MKRGVFGSYSRDLKSENHISSCYNPGGIGHHVAKERECEYLCVWCVCICVVCVRMHVVYEMCLYVYGVGICLQ